MCCKNTRSRRQNELQPNGDKRSDAAVPPQTTRACVFHQTYSEDEADGGHAGGGHHFGTVGDQVEEDGHGGLRRVVEATAEHCRQVAGEQSRTRDQTLDLFCSDVTVQAFGVSPQSDAGLSHHLRPEVLGGQFERRLQETQLLQKPVKLRCAGQEQRAHLLQLEEQRRRRRRSDRQSRVSSNWSW